MNTSLIKYLMELYTKGALFLSPTGGIYQQVEDVTMGYPLGPIFVNFYMWRLEN